MCDLAQRRPIGNIKSMPRRHTFSYFFPRARVGLFQVLSNFISFTFWSNIQECLERFCWAPEVFLTGTQSSTWLNQVLARLDCRRCSGPCDRNKNSSDTMRRSRSQPFLFFLATHVVRRRSIQVTWGGRLVWIAKHCRQYAWFDRR